MAKRIILSGMRPTGKLHLGNYFGALANWVKLQADPETRCFFMIADWHALTTDYERTDAIESNIAEMAADWLAAGLDPEKSVIFRQSWVPEHAELALILSMITPISWLERNPTYKEQMNELKDREISTHGFLGYPVLQAADILLYDATHVPVGEDQLPHLELTREIARRFNHLYKRQVLIEPQAILSTSSKLPGLDGRKMSKSYDNCVYLSDSEKQLQTKVNSMFTDPNKKRLGDKGHPEPSPENPTGCVVYALHKIYEGSAEKTARRGEICGDGTLGCGDCKKDLFNEMNAALAPIRARRQDLRSRNVRIDEVLKAGSARAAEAAGRAMQIVSKAMQVQMGSGHVLRDRAPSD